MPRRSSRKTTKLHAKQAPTRGKSRVGGSRRGLLPISGVVFFVACLSLIAVVWLLRPAPLPAPEKALATYQFAPTGGTIVTGTSPAILGATAAAAEGVNLGSWRATLADDNFHWGITSTASGYNVHLDIGNVQLSGANALIIQTEFDLDATAPATLVQICDWVSSTGVHNAADAHCTGGGWRNLNLNDTTITTATATSYSWQIYNGYWDASATASISTPLTNFVNPSNAIRIRYFSTTNTTTTVHIDHLRVFAVIHPIYSASGATIITSGTLPAAPNNYSQTAIGGVGQTGADDARFRVPGTSTVVSDFFFSFNNVRTYTGANTILVRAEYSCSATGINHRPRIWNFHTSAWEDLTTASIACSTTDAANAWARNNINLAHYVSNGEVRVGWTGLANGTQEIRIDFIYIMIGTTNTSGTAELTFGSTNAGTPANTQNLDMTGTASTWNILSADESNTQAFPQYAFDSDGDATAEEASAANLDFDVTVPTGAAVTGVFFASRHMSGVAGTVGVGVRDYGGVSQVLGGWTAVGAGGTTALAYTDNITAATVASGGHAGMHASPKDHVNTVGNRMNMRLRTTVSGAATNNSVAQWDFAMVSIQWVETPTAPPTETLTFSLGANSLALGVLSPATTATGSHTVTVGTNAAGGLVLTFSGATLTSGSHTITAMTATAASSPGAEQFGINAVANTSPAVGAACSGSPPIATAASGYSTANQFRFVSGETIISSAGAINSTTCTISYIANISGVTAAGSYSTTLTYVVTGTF